MTEHILLFNGIAHADMGAVLSRRLFARDGDTGRLEELLKSQTPSFSELLPAGERLAATELNYIAACVCAWSCEETFYQALASELLPTLIYVAQDSGDYEFDEHFYLESCPPEAWRRRWLEQRIEDHTRSAQNLSTELGRLNHRLPVCSEAPA